MKHPDPEALKMIYWSEIANTYGLLRYRFEGADEVKDGVISLEHYK